MLLSWNWFSPVVFRCASISCFQAVTEWVSNRYFFRSSVYTVCTVYTVYTITPDLQSIQSLQSLQSQHSQQFLQSLQPLRASTVSSVSTVYTVSKSLQSPQVNLAHHRVDFRAFFNLWHKYWVLDLIIIEIRVICEPSKLINHFFSTCPVLQPVHSCQNNPFGVPVLETIAKNWFDHDQAKDLMATELQYQKEK